MEQLQLFQIDAFTDTPFHGNPAAVCLLTHPLDDETLQAIATEMNLSETAFLGRTSDTPWNANDGSRCAGSPQRRKSPYAAMQHWQPPLCSSAPSA